MLLQVTMLAYGCKCKTSERFDTEKEWSISDPTAGARTIEENLSLSQLPKSRKKYVSNCPIFQSIPLTHVVIDNLHLFLRVSDKLITLLVTELRRQDKIEKQKKFTSFDPVKYKYCDGYQKFVSSLGIPNFEFYIGRTSRELKTRSLTGPEKLKVFHNVNIEALLPNFDSTECARIQNLWTGLLELNMLFSKPAGALSPLAIDEFKQGAKQWVRDFIDVYHNDNVTPYIHAMMQNVSQFMTIHGSILSFTQQGLEKHNDNTTIQLVTVDDKRIPSCQKEN